jgi:hypothetical protein
MPVYSVQRPHPEHVPTLGRVARGRPPTMGGRGNLYATTIRCSCGGWRTQINEAPSKGGKTLAGFAYRDHLKEAGVQ